MRRLQQQLYTKKLLSLLKTWESQLLLLLLLLLIPTKTATPLFKCYTQTASVSADATHCFCCLRYCCWCCFRCCLAYCCCYCCCLGRSCYCCCFCDGAAGAWVAPAATAAAAAAWGAAAAASCVSAECAPADICRPLHSSHCTCFSNCMHREVMFNNIIISLF